MERAVYRWPEQCFTWVAAKAFDPRVLVGLRSSLPSLEQSRSQVNTWALLCQVIAQGKDNAV